jgi:hypothetical protein
MQETTMLPKTLLDHAGARLQPAALSEAVLVLIDMQREYSDGQPRSSMC